MTQKIKGIKEEMIKVDFQEIKEVEEETMILGEEKSLRLQLRLIGTEAGRINLLETINGVMIKMMINGHLEMKERKAKTIQ